MVAFARTRDRRAPSDGDCLKMEPQLAGPLGVV